MVIEKTNQKKEQGAVTKKKLYESAKKLFSKYNFSDVSVKSIAEAAGVTKGTFYVHFNSKDELFMSILADYTSYIDMEYRLFVESLPSDMSASNLLLALIGKIADVLIDTIGYDNMKTIYTLQLTRAVNTEPVKGYNRELYKMFSDILDQGIQQGDFKTNLPLDTLTKHFVMAIRGLTYEWCIRYPNFDLKEQALMHFKLLMKGIMANI